MDWGAEESQELASTRLRLKYLLDIVWMHQGGHWAHECGFQREAKVLYFLNGSPLLVCLHL